MRGILPEASRGLRDKRIFRYAGRSAGADRKRSESAAAIEVLPVTATPPGRSRAELVDDDVHQSVVTDQVRGFAERIALAGQRISRARDPRHDLHLLSCGEHAARNHRVLLGELHGLWEAAGETLDGQWRPRLLRIAHEDEQWRGVRRGARKLRCEGHMDADGRYGAGSTRTRNGGRVVTRPCGRGRGGRRRWAALLS